MHTSVVDANLAKRFALQPADTQSVNIALSVQGHANRLHMQTLMLLMVVVDTTHRYRPQGLLHVLSTLLALMKGSELLQNLLVEEATSNAPKVPELPHVASAEEDSLTSSEK